MGHHGVSSFLKITHKVAKQLALQQPSILVMFVTWNQELSLICVNVFSFCPTKVISMATIPNRHECSYKTIIFLVELKTYYAKRWHHTPHDNFVCCVTEYVFVYPVAKFIFINKLFKVEMGIIRYLQFVKKLMVLFCLFQLYSCLRIKWSLVFQFLWRSETCTDGNVCPVPAFLKHF